MKLNEEEFFKKLEKVTAVITDVFSDRVVIEVMDLLVKDYIIQNNLGELYEQGNNLHPKRAHVKGKAA